MFKRADHFIRSQVKLQRSPGQLRLLSNFHPRRRSISGSMTKLRNKNRPSEAITLENFRPALSQRAARKSSAPRTVKLLWRLATHGSCLGNPRGMLAVLPRWEQFSRRLHGLKKFPGSHLSLLQFRLRRFRGPSLLLADNTRIERGTTIFVSSDDDGRFNNALQAGPTQRHKGQTTIVRK